MVLKEILNGFSQTKKHAAESAMKTKQTNILPKNEFGNEQCYCRSLKCEIVYDGIVSYQTCLDINANQEHMQIQSTVFMSLMQLLVTHFPTKILTY